MDLFNEKEVGECYEFLAHDNETEIRLLDPKKIKRPFSIFVTNKTDFINECKKYNGQYNLYAGINERTTGGKEKSAVISVKTLVIDIDAVRDIKFKGQPATDLELLEAEKICDKILKNISNSGQPTPVKLCSGNGFQIWIAISKIVINDMNRDEVEFKIQTFQDSVINFYSINDCIDKIGDLPRIIKIWGTLNIKGNESENRPYRVAKVIGDISYRVENDSLKEDIINYKIKNIEENIDLQERIDEFDLQKLPPCIGYILKYYENKDGSYWFRLVQYLASFFRTIGLTEQKTLETILYWNNKQGYHESNDSFEIKEIVSRVFRKGLNCPNCEKVKNDSSGFPKCGLAEAKVCKKEGVCNRCVNPVVVWKKLNEPEAEKLKFENKIDDTDICSNVEEFHKKQPFFYNRAGLFWFWDFKKFKWIIRDDVDVFTAISENLSDGRHIVTSYDKNSYLEAFKIVGRKNIPLEPPKSWVQFFNEIYDLESGERFEATAKYFFTNPIPHRLGFDTNTPVIDSLISTWVESKYNYTVYEILAYCLLSDYPVHRLFCFYGSGSNGKSCYLRLISNLCGRENVTSTDLYTLIDSRFERSRLYKKLVCEMGEIDFDEMSKSSILKKLTGQDLIGYEYKNKGYFDDVNYAKIIISTNNMPQTLDKTDGFYRRWLIIDFPNTFTEEKDIMSTIPESEYSALCLKLVGILKSILKNRGFTNEGTIEERRKKYEDKSNPLDKFFNECVITDCEPDANIAVWDFKKRFEEWCRFNKFRVIPSEVIVKSMATKGIIKERTYSGWYSTDKTEKKQYWAWLGIKWVG